MFFFRNRNGFERFFSKIFSNLKDSPNGTDLIPQGFVERIPGVTTLVKDPVSGDLRARSGNQVPCGWVSLLVIQRGGVPLPNKIPGNRLGLKKEFQFPNHHF